MSQNFSRSDGSSGGRSLRVLSAAVVLLSIVAVASLVANIPAPFFQTVALVALALAAILSLVVLVGWSTPPPGGDLPEKLVADFGDEGVTVTVPWQGMQMKVRKLPPLQIPDHAKDPNTYARSSQSAGSISDPPLTGRRVINFEVVSADDPSETPLPGFTKPIEIRVAYTQQDVDHAKGVENLALGFWDGRRWMHFTKQKHGFELKGGAGIAHVRRWDDPQIVWGP